MGFYIFSVPVVWRCNVMYLAFFVPSVLPLRANGIVRWSLAHTHTVDAAMCHSSKSEGKRREDFLAQWLCFDILVFERIGFR